MNTSNSLRVRPQSAKYAFNSAKRNTSMRSQIRQDSRLMYTQGSNSKPIYSITKTNIPELKRLLPNRTDMSPERLFQENMGLKKKLNQVTDQLKIERAKGETVERRNAKWKKRLDIEFEKQMYWGHKGEYMVMGVKNQYDKIKKMYDQKCKENQQIKRNLKYSELQEVRAELEAYKSETIRLKQELDKFIEIYNIPYKVEDQDERSNKLLVEELKQVIIKLQDEINTYKTGIRNFDKIVKDRDQKIEFLQRLTIDKDNYAYQMEQTSKRLQHDNENIRNKNKQIKQNMEEQKKAIDQRINDIKQNCKRQIQYEQERYRNQLEFKQQKITKLQAQTVYLSTLLAQWRPTQNDLMRNSFTNQINENKSIIVPRKQSNVALSVISGEGIDKDRENYEFSKSSLDQNMFVNSSGIKKEKNTHYSLKRDIVKKEQIENICLQIKFRLLNQKIDINTAKSYIKSSIEGQDISIKDLIEIFSKQPFCMQSQARRVLLARYLIEQVNEGTVYYDQQRSQSQVIVRSIFEQIIPKFTIVSESQQANIKSKVSDMITKYHVTLGQVVSQYNRQMTFNQKKFVEILDQQQLNMGQQYNDYMVSHMLKSSPDITQLNFKALLSLVVQKQN